MLFVLERSFLVLQNYFLPKHLLKGYFISGSKVFRGLPNIPRRVCILFGKYWVLWSVRADKDVCVYLLIRFSLRHGSIVWMSAWTIVVYILRSWLKSFWEWIIYAVVTVLFVINLFLLNLRHKLIRLKFLLDLDEISNKNYIEIHSSTLPY